MTLRLDVGQRLRGDILAGRIAFGARLTMEELALRYGSSHMPIREALRELQGEGLVVTEPNRSARVRAIDRDFVGNLMEVRIALETALARQAARGIAKEELARLEAIETRLEALNARSDHPAVLMANRDFHSTIYAAAGNPEGLVLIDRHWRLIAALWDRYGYGPERFAGVASDHRHLLKALRDGDGLAAAAITTAHVIKARQDLLDRMTKAEQRSAVPA
jgi:DNA-binding GntR family transcriptional regulator